MKLEQQVCTPDQGKRLCKLGISQDSLVCYCLFCPNPLGEYHYYETAVSDNHSANPGERIAALFTVSELLVLLPKSVDASRRTNLVIRCDGYDYTVLYDMDAATGGGYGPTVKDTFNDLEASSERLAVCLADLLIWLLEKSIINVADCNTRFIA